MKAAQLIGFQKFAIVDVPRPEPAYGECLIELQTVSVCGSDTRHGYRPRLDASQYPRQPGFPGHECAGVVVESRSAGLTPGQRVVVHPKGSVGLVEYLVADPTRLAVVPETGDLARWLMVEPPATVLHACRRLGPVLGARVAIIGQGPMGLCWTHFMNRLGAAQIVVSDLEEGRRRRAWQFGATDVLDASTASFEAAAARLTNGEMFDVVVDAAGEEETAALAPRLARRGGTVVYFGIPESDELLVDFRTLRNRELSTLCTAPGRGNDVGHVIADMVELVNRGWFEPAQFITHHLPFESVGTAFRMYDNREDDILKVVLSLNGRESL